MQYAVGSDSTTDDGSPSRVLLFEDIEINGCGLVFEELAWSDGFKAVAGIDEVGRGCVAGPVIAVACILDPNKPLPDGLNDSKQVAQERREEIAAELKENCVAYAIGTVDAPEIDRINILEATKVAMRHAIADLTPSADYLLVDALQLKGVLIPQRSIIKGDSVSASIAAASILAKTHRDELMRSYDVTYPQYGFSDHVGYGTKAHLAAIKTHGPCPLHRMTFRGVTQN
jgi:ribonuclease HII